MAPETSTGNATTMVPTATRPTAPLATAVTSSRVRAWSDSTDRAKRTTTSPAGVGSVPRLDRVNSATPYRRSTSASIFETAGCVSARKSAARPSWRNRSRATSNCRCRSLRLERRTRSIWLMDSP